MRTTVLELLSRARFLAILLPMYAFFSSMQIGCGLADTNAVTSSPVYGSYGRNGDGHYGYYGYYGCTEGFGYFDDLTDTYGCDE